jgi:hypothetical protein
MPRAYLQVVPNLTIDKSSLSNLVIAQTMNSFTGVMNVNTGVIYLCGLSGEGDTHYNTQIPTHLNAFPQKVNGGIIAPIVHKDPILNLTSHDQLALAVVNRGGGTDTNDFCGFALRFRAKPEVLLSPTSRTLNSGDGFSTGNIEDIVKQALIVYLRPKLALLGWTLSGTGVRTDPDAAQAARGGVVAPAGLFAQLRK